MGRLGKHQQRFQEVGSPPGVVRARKEAGDTITAQKVSAWLQATQGKNGQPEAGEHRRDSIRKSGTAKRDRRQYGTDTETEEHRKDSIRKSGSARRDGKEYGTDTAFDSDDSPNPQHSNVRDAVKPLMATHEVELAVLKETIKALKEERQVGDFSHSSVKLKS